MIVVDSSVWVDWFRHVETPETIILDASDPDEILVGDIILLELLSGASDDLRAQKLEKKLREYETVSMLDSQLAAKAAAGYRLLRSRGITIRTTSDLIIGTFCIAHDHMLLQNDRDFLPMQKHLGLRLA